MKNGLSFVTAADEGFHQGLEVLLKSFVVANRALAPLQLMVMDCGLTADFVATLQQKMTEFGEAQGVELTLEVKIADLSRWQGFPPHWDSYAAYAFMEALHMVETRFLVFADADMLHYKNLESTVQALDESGRMVAGVVDSDYKTLAHDFYVNHLSPLEESQEALPYLNSGYLIFDRSRFLFAELDQFIASVSREKAHERFKGVKKFKHDQTLINAFIKGDCHVLDESFNYFCKENQRFVSLGEPCNFHFVSNPKPWEPGTAETLGREVVFKTAEHVLCGAGAPLEMEMSGLDRGKMGLLKTCYTILGKAKKAKRYRQAEISPQELHHLAQQITSWSKSE